MIDKSILEKLYYKKKFSVAEIAQQLDRTFPSTLYWVRKHGIKIRSYSDRAYVKVNRNGDPFDPKLDLTSDEQTLFYLGLGLYWGEGSRKSKWGVQLGNLDTRLIQMFLKFIREIARVEESRIRLDVRIHEQFSKKATKHYWCQALKLSPAQVFVCHHMDKRSNPKKQWSPYGIAAICVANTKFKAWMDLQLEQNIKNILEA